MVSAKNNNFRCRRQLCYPRSDPRHGMPRDFVGARRSASSVKPASPPHLPRVSQILPSVCARCDCLFQSGPDGLNYRFQSARDRLPTPHSILRRSWAHLAHTTILQHSRQLFRRGTKTGMANQHISTALGRFFDASKFAVVGASKDPSKYGNKVRSLSPSSSPNLMVTAQRVLTM